MADLGDKMELTAKFILVKKIVKSHASFLHTNYFCPSVTFIVSRSHRSSHISSRRGEGSGARGCVLCSATAWHQGTWLCPTVPEALDVRRGGRGSHPAAPASAGEAGDPHPLQGAGPGPQSVGRAAGATPLLVTGWSHTLRLSARARHGRRPGARRAAARGRRRVC